MAEAPAEQIRTIRKLEAKGIKVKRFPDTVLAELRKGWNQVRDEEMKKNPLFKKAYESLMEHSKLVDEWYELQAIPH